MAGWPQRLRDLRGGTVPTLQLPNFYYSTKHGAGNEPAQGEVRDWTTSVGSFQPRNSNSNGSPIGSPVLPPCKVTKDRKGPSSPLLSTGSRKAVAPASPRQARLRDLLAEAAGIAQTLIDAEMNFELMDLLATLNRAMGMRMKEDPLEARHPHATIPEIKRLGTSPFLFRQLCHAEAVVELLLGLAFDFAGVQSIYQLQTRAATFCPFVAKADTCNLYLCHDNSLYDVASSGDLPLAGILGYAARGWETCHVLYPTNDPRFDPRTDSLRARVYYCQPLQCGGRLLGLLRLLRFDEDAVMFSAEELHVVDALAEMVAFNLQRLLQAQMPTQGFSESEAELHASQSESLLSLAKHLANAALDEKKLVAAVMQQARNLTHSDRCSLFVVKDDELEAHFEDGHMVRMQLDTGIAGYVARTGERVEIEDAYKDNRFNKMIDQQTGYRTTSMLCLPVMYENSVVAVAQLVNKLDEQRRTITFSKTDIELFEPFAEFVGICLRNCRLHTKLAAQEQRGALYRKVLEEITSGQSLEDDDNDVCDIITTGIQGLLGCQACALYAVDYEGQDMQLESITALGDDGVMGTNVATPRAEFEAIAQQVRKSRAQLLIPNAAQHEALQHLSDVVGSFLTLPIISKDKVIGVTQVLKRDAFSASDLEVVSSLSMFAGIALSNRHLLEFVVQANKQATGLIRMHSMRGQLSPRKTSITLVPLDTNLVMKAMLLPLPSETKALAKTLNFDLFEYMKAPPESDKPLELIPVLALFFEELGLMDHFGIQRHVLFRFLLRARTLYRPVPYHNFFHAVDVTHMLYYLITMLDPVVHFEPVEKLALMVAATVHDVDHMGLNNSYHLKCDTPMGILYSSVGIDSVLEIHHCNVALDIMSQPEHNVFEGLSEADSKTAFRLLVEIILATDMAHHSHLLTDFVEACKGKSPAAVDRVLLLKMLIKSADLSNVIRPFFLAQQWAVCVTEEFYAQGDQEKKHGKEVTAMFDRTKNANLAASQIGFINAVGKRHFTAIRDFCPERLGWVMENLEANVEGWEKVQACPERATM